MALLLAWSLAAGCATTQAAADPQSSEAVASDGTQPPPAVLPTAPASVDGTTIAVAAEVAPDAQMVALLAPLAEEVAARANRVVGALATPLDKAKDGAPESTLGNFAADALHHQIEKMTGKALDVCFTNNGGLRRSIPAGPVTEGVLVELMPFDNAVVILDVKGERATELLTRVAERGDPASGMTYVRHGAGQPIDLAIGGAPVEADKTYSICTNDYLYEGGGNYGMQDITAVTYTGILIRDTFIAAFEDQPAGEAISVSLDGRALDADAEGGTP